MAILNTVKYVPGEWREPYYDVDYTRKYQGFELPVGNEGSLRRVYGASEISSWDCLRMTRCRCAFVTPDGKAIGKQRVHKLLGNYDTPMSLLSSYLTFPNGTVKNFLNACRATWDLRGNVRVAVLGSKAMEGGGLWHKYFAMWLAGRVQSLVIDFYDMAETEEEWTLEVQGTQVSCMWFPGKISADLSLHYDAYIDDVWTFEEGAGVIDRVQITYASGSHISRKGGPEDYDPFLHSSETRQFSHPPSDYKSLCQCMTCVVVAQCSLNYPSFVFLRQLCSRLGHVQKCVGISWVSELNQVFSLNRALSMQSEVDIRTFGVVRFLMSLSEETGLMIGKNKVQKKGEPGFLPLNRFKKKEKGKREKVEEFPHLRKKRVMFCGVPSSVVGETEIFPPGRDPEVIFVSSLDLWSQRLDSPVVYCSVNEKEALVSFPDWVPTGNQVRNFKEYRRENKKFPSVRDLTVLSPHCQQGTMLLPGLKPFPYIRFKNEMGKYVETISNGRIYSWSVSGPYLELVEFDPQKWRQAVVCNGRAWSLLKNNLHLYTAKYAMQSAGRVPWDISLTELRNVFKKELWHVELWRLFLLGKRLGAHLANWWQYFGEKKRLYQIIKEQKEFILSDDGILSRTPESLPFWEEGYLKGWELTMREARVLPYEEGYKKVQEASRRYFSLSLS